MYSAAWRRSSVLTLASALTALATPVRAVCPQAIIPNALAGRVEASVLEQLKGTLLQRIPDFIPIPEAQYAFYACPLPGGDDYVFTPRNGVMSLGFDELTVEPRWGWIELRAVLDLQAQANLDMILCGLPDDECPATFSASDVSVQARLTPRVEGCSLTFDVDQTQITFVPALTTAELLGCGLTGAAFNALYDAFRDAMIALAEEEINRLASEYLPGWLRGLTSGLFDRQIPLGQLEVLVAPQSLTIQPTWIEAVFAAAATPANGAAACLPAGSVLPAPDPPLPAMPPFGSGALSVIASRAFAQHLLQAAWFAGAFCWDTTELEVDLGALLQPVVPGLQLFGRALTRKPPLLRLRADPAGDQAAIILPAVHAELDVGASDIVTSTIQADTTAALIAEVTVDLELQALVAALQDVEASAVDVLLGDETVIFSAAAIASLLQDLVVPQLVEAVGPLPLSSGLLPLVAVAVLLDQATVDAEWVRADLSLWPIRPDDRIPPRTIVTSQLPAIVGPELSLTVASLDDDTPAAFMRHAVYLDARRVLRPTAGQQLRLTGLAAGAHTLAVVAIDLAGNSDATPVTLPVTIDATPPEIVFGARPWSFIGADATSVGYEIRDDHSPPARLQSSYRLTTVGVPGQPSLVLSEGELPATGTLDLRGLPDDRIVVLRITSLDEVGNRGQAELSFGIMARPTYGCAATAGPMAWMPLLLALGLFLAAGGRRRAGVRRNARPRAAGAPGWFHRLVPGIAVLGAIAPDARASLAGDMFGGPVRPGGFSMFWNPANASALPAGLHTAIDLVGIYLDVSYQRAGLDPVKGTPFGPAAFTLPGGDLGLSLAWTTPLPWLTLVGGTYSPRARMGRWPPDGPTRYHITTGYIFSQTVEAGFLIKPRPWLGIALTGGPVYNLAHLEYKFDFGNYVNDALGVRLFTPEDPTMEGQATVDNSAWSVIAAAGLWAELRDWWRLGLGLTIPSVPRLRGGVRVDIPELFNQSLPPDKRLQIRSRIQIDHPIPWTVSLENEWQIGSVTAAVLVHYIGSSAQHQLVGYLYRPQPDVIGDRNLLNYGTRDDLVLAARGSYHLDEAWEVGARFDWSPKNTPEELATGGNIDFTLLELTLGARWRPAPELTLSANLSHVFLVPVEIRNSIYTTEAPFESGLSQPSVNGLFRARADRVMIGALYRWGGPGLAE